MTKARVQVEGLGRAVPGLQSAVPQLGGYRVQVQETPSWQETKLGQLAVGLGVTVQGVQELKAIGDIKEQKAIDDLTDKSIEDLNKEFIDNRGKLDKEVRKGFLPFMGNPWNQERVRKAAGAQYHDEFQLRLQQALEKSDSTTPTDKVVQDVIAGMTEDYESLKDVTIRQGFNAASKNTIQQYSLRYNAIKNQQNENELFRGGRSVMFNGATLITDQNGVTKMADAAAIDEWWEENEGAFKPARLAELRKTVATDLAYRDPDSARAFLKHTQGFKAGTTKMGDPDIKDDDVFSMYAAEEAALYEAIDNIEIQDQAKNVHAANREFAVIDELAVDIGMAIKAGQVFVTKEGEEISNEKQAKTYLLNKLQQSDNILVRGSNGVKTVQTALKLLETEPDNFIPFFNKIRNVGLDNNLNNRLKQAEGFILSQHLMEVTGADGIPKNVINPLYQGFASEIRFELDEERRQKIRELSSGNYLNVKGEEVRSTAWDSEVMEDMARWDRYYHEQFQTRLKEKINGKLEQDKKDAEEASKQKATRDIIEGKSFLDPTTPLNQATTLYKDLPNIFSAFTNPYDLESNLREGDLEDARSWAENFEKENLKVKTLPLPLLGSIPVLNFQPQSLFSYRNELEQTIKLIQDPKVSTESKEKAQKLMSLYLFAKGLYTPENIANGNVNIEVGSAPETTKFMNFRQAQRKGFEVIDRPYPGVNALVKVPAVEGVSYNVRIDREAVKRFAEIFPMIPKERLIEMSRVGTDDLSKEQAMYEAIHNVTPDEATLMAWIEQQRDLAQRIYKN